MFLTNHVAPEDASGKVAEIYGMFPPGVPVPEPMQMFSVSPGLLERQAAMIKYFMTHDRFDFGFLAMLRYLLALKYEYTFCERFNDGLLRAAGGLTDGEMAALREGPENAPLEEEQKSLLAFAYKVATDPDGVTETDVQQQRDLGWTDNDIFDAAFHGTSMVGVSMLFRALRK